MKLTINLEQLDELNGKGKEKLLEWALDKEYTEWTNQCNDTECNCAYVKDFFISIGQMIEFLDENSGREELVIRIHSAGMGWQRPGERLSDILLNGHELTEDNVELCDALWEAVKEKANKE